MTQTTDLDSLKIKAELAQNQKKALKFLEETTDSVRSGDTLVVFHREESDLLVGLILDILGGEPVNLSKDERKILADVYKHISG